MKGFRFVIYFLVLFLVECKGEKPVFHPKESYVSFKIIQNDFPNIIHSINYGYDFVNDILFYRKSFLDTVIYIIDTKTSQIDSILTPVFNKSSLIVIDKDCFVLDFITKSTPANSETVLYKIIGKKVIKVNSFNYTNDKGYPEIDIFKQLNDSELVACDFNNNIIYNLSWNSTPIFHSTIISADSLESIGKFKWSDNVISIESLDTLDSIVVRKNQLSIDFKEKYALFGLNDNVYIIGTNKKKFNMILLNLTSKENFKTEFSTNISCFSSSLKIGSNGVVWFCNGSLNVVRW